MSNLMGALTRLERAGSDSSRTTKKLHEAAALVAEKICDSVRIGKAIGVSLPRGYRVQRCKSNIGYEDYLTMDIGIINEFGYADVLYIDGTDGFLHRDFSCPIPPQTRDGSMRFAADVSSGLLDEIAEFLEKRGKEETVNANALREHLHEMLG